MNDSTAAVASYTPRRIARSQFVDVRGLAYHLLAWGQTSGVTATRPPLLMLHGWMDVAASFQFVVDALAAQGDGAASGERYIVAADWRGFGLSATPPLADSYWFPDYLGDLDALLDHLSPDAPVDLLGHSMGGNVAMLYAGVRPARVRRLINLEGFGQPESSPAQAPKRLAQWLDELKTPQELRRYASLEAVAARLRKTNPLLPPERADWLAAHWSRRGDDGRWEILGDAAHKRVNPVLYRKDEVLECWRRITAPTLWVEGDRTDISLWWGERYTKAQFHERLAVVPNVEKHVLAPAGHMLHHDQPEALARVLRAFLDAP
jgi:pimeloyl-ACP methyl ester carboxylesterase